MLTTSCLRVRGSRVTFICWAADPKRLPFIRVEDPKLTNYEADPGCGFYTATPACTLGRVFSDKAVIHPSWTKVSITPWGKAAQVCGGYGRRVSNGTSSADAPDFMRSTTFEGHKPLDFCVRSTFKANARFKHCGESGSAVSEEAPSFFHLKHTEVLGRGPAVDESERPPLAKMALGRQIVAEPLIDGWPGQELPPLDWGGEEQIEH